MRTVPPTAASARLRVRRPVLTALAASLAGAVLPALPARAQAFRPSKPITYLISVAPGGSVDQYARGIKQMLEQHGLVNGQSVIAENRPGAAGLLTVQAMRRAAGDAHYLSAFHTGGIAGSVSGALKADVRELTPVAMLVEESTFVVANADSALRSAQDLLAALRRDPGSVRIAVAPAPGQNTHLAIAKPLKAAGIDVRRLTIVPFRSSGESMTALVGGHIDVVSATGPAILPHRARSRVLATVAPQRAGAPFDDVPTWRELGVAADYVSYNGVNLPPGVDALQIRYWEEALRQVSAMPQWRELVQRSGNRPIFLGYVDSHRYLMREYEQTRVLLEELGLAGAFR